MLEPGRREFAEAAEDRIFRKFRQTPNAACVQRVLRLLTLITGAERLRLNLVERWFMALKDPAFAKRQEELHRFDFRHPQLAELDALQLGLIVCLRRIEECGKRYRWSPSIGRSQPWALTPMFNWPKHRPDWHWENAAVAWLMHNSDSSGLTPSRLLRLRQCKECSGWFCANTDHQQHCSRACRQKFHSHNPEFREKRRRYMREMFRPRAKQEELRSKSIARGTK
jgi:hypothetical protein